MQIANRTEYGLTAGVFTRGRHAAPTAGRCRSRPATCGSTARPRHYSGLPFGGVKASGVGREESVDELLSYTETKAVTVVLE